MLERAKELLEETIAFVSKDAQQIENLELKF